MPKRLFDITFALLLLVIFLLPMMLIAAVIHFTSGPPILFLSKRIGRNNKIFSMPKFRTMHLKTPQKATHLIENPQEWLIPIGSLLRQTSLDEIPQLWSILRGDMSFVGPRPALFNQDDLIGLRKKTGVDQLTPGLTGWAQINGRDKLSIPDKVALDTEYLQQKSLWLDIKILIITLYKAALGFEVNH